MTIFQKNVQRLTHSPMSLKEIQKGYLVASHFKNIYFYLTQNKLPYAKFAIGKLNTLLEKYILLDSWCFTIITIPERETH